MKILKTLINWFLKFRSKPKSRSTSQTLPQRTKRALLVGIDKYAMPGNNLRGCVADAQDMHDLLASTYGFDKKNVRVLTNERATKQTILQNLAWLINSSKCGDEALYYHSGHGTQVRDIDGDELIDHLDECLVTHDFDWNNPLIDDLIYKSFKKLPKGAFLTMICDTCHSGSISRSFEHPNFKTAKTIVPPFDIACHFDRKLKVNRIGKKNDQTATQRHIHLSGCQDNETSQEALMGGKVRGALTYFLTKYLRKNPDHTWYQTHKATCNALKNARYTQHPNLTGNPNLLRRLVLGGR